MLSSSASSKAPLLFCQNPFCLNFNKKPFSNQAAYTQHIDRNIGCYNFIVKKSHHAATHGASASHRRRLHEDGNITCTSNKRPALLRRHMVNDPHMDFDGTDNLLQFPAGNGVEVESTSCEDIDIGCYNFIVKKSHHAATHGASASHRRRLHEDGNITCTSNKRPALFRRHMVNDPHMDFDGTDNLLQFPAGNGVEVESTSCEDIEDCNKVMICPC
ncbi:hypothetical protein MHU86_387 [Fragilaria crotonensis]|nr:hypothetical protein MHU86_387 [Fragilaria crotonensis]